ncbi:tetratricopeptide repeat protein [Caulobacter sp. ErkDOM-E]|uniref:tetratricopeptide repeat protein n=1 Tax=Caulobacter sp. ErkDOM-E TaxID=3402778 RepID=UPI003AF74928
MANRERGAAAAIMFAWLLLSVAIWPGMAGAAQVTEVEKIQISPVKAGRWLKAESPRFIVYSDGDERLLRDYVVKLELFDTLLRHLHNMPLDGAPPRKLSIFLIRERAQFDVVWPGMPSSVSGFYTSSVGDIFAMAIRSRDDNTVVQHEYVHHFMLQYFPYGYPAWLVEGYAEYFGSAEVGRDTIAIGRNTGRGGNLEDIAWAPVRSVLAKRPYELKGTDRAMFYAEAWLMTHYFMSDPVRYQQLTAYMKAVGSGDDPVKAMEAASGLSAEALQAKLRDYMRVKIQVVTHTLKGLPAPPVEVTALSKASDDLLLADFSLRRFGLANDDDEDEDEDSEGALEARAEARSLRAKWRVAFLADIQVRAARYPGERLAELVLARAELALGDPEKGRVLIDAFTQARPDDAEGLELAGLARLAAGDRDEDHRAALYKEAGQLLGQAYKLDPTRYQTLYGYARSRSLDPKYPTPNVMAVLEEAQALAPQVSQITLATAQAMMLRDRDDEAAALLGPVANSPHGGAEAARARAMLKALSERKAKGEGDK